MNNKGCLQLCSNIKEHLQKTQHTDNRLMVYYGEETEPVDPNDLIVTFDGVEQEISIDPDGKTFTILGPKTDL